MNREASGSSFILPPSSFRRVQWTRAPQRPRPPATGGQAMPPYRQMGSIPRKRHIEHRAQPGYRGEGIYYEEVVTTAGFGRSYSIAYHLRPPTRVRKIEPAGYQPLETVEQPVL